MVQEKAPHAEVLASVRADLRKQLRQRVDASALAAAPRTERRLRVRDEALAVLRASGAILPQRELARVVNEISDEVVGFGPIEFLLKDPDVTEETRAQKKAGLACARKQPGWGRPLVSWVNDPEPEPEKFNRLLPGETREQKTERLVYARKDRKDRKDREARQARERAARRER